MPEVRVRAVPCFHQRDNMHSLQAAQLKANSDALTTAKTKMAALASGSSRRRHKGARQTETSCSAVITKATTCRLSGVESVQTGH